MFENQAEAELQLEMFEDLLMRRERILEKLETYLEHGERAILNEQLQDINEVFGTESELGEDDLIDEWERDLEMGNVPDLDKKPR